MRKALLYLVALAAMILLSCSSQSRSFDSREWRIGRCSLRGTMVQDLIDGGALIDRTPSDVERLLGPPDYRKKSFSSGMAIESLRFRDVVSRECRLDVSFDATRVCVVSAALSE